MEGRSGWWGWEKLRRKVFACWCRWCLWKTNGRESQLGASPGPSPQGPWCRPPYGPALPTPSLATRPCLGSAHLRAVWELSTPPPGSSGAGGLTPLQRPWHHLLSGVHPASQLLKYCACAIALNSSAAPAVPLPHPQSRNSGIHPDYWPDSVTPTFQMPGACLPNLINSTPSESRLPDKASLQSPLTYQTWVLTPTSPSRGQALDLLGPSSQTFVQTDGSDTPSWGFHCGTHTSDSFPPLQGPVYLVPSWLFSLPHCLIPSLQP